MLTMKQFHVLHKVVDQIYEETEEQGFSWSVLAARASSAMKQCGDSARTRRCTRTPPTEPGDYWNDNGTSIVLLHLVKDSDGELLVKHQPHGARTSAVMFSVATYGGRWQPADDDRSNVPSR
jgi:hypothetical protein